MQSEGVGGGDGVGGEKQRRDVVGDERSGICLDYQVETLRLPDKCVAWPVLTRIGCSGYELRS